MYLRRVYTYTMIVEAETSKKAQRFAWEHSVDFEVDVWDTGKLHLIKFYTCADRLWVRKEVKAVFGDSYTVRIKDYNIVITKKD